MYSSEPMSEREARSLSSVADELSVAAQKAMNAAQSLTMATNSETLVNLFKLVKDLADTAKKTEINSHGIEQSSQKIVSSFENLTENINSFLSKVDNIDLSKLDGFCVTKEIVNLRFSLDITKWISAIVGICLFIGGLSLYFGAILPLNNSQSEVAAAIGESSDRYIQLLDQRKADIEAIKQKDAEILDLKAENKKMADFVMFTHHYDKDLILLKKKEFDALKR